MIFFREVAHRTVRRFYTLKCRAMLRKNGNLNTVHLMLIRGGFDAVDAGIILEDAGVPHEYAKFITRMNPELEAHLKSKGQFEQLLNFNLRGGTVHNH